MKRSRLCACVRHAVISGALISPTKARTHCQFTLPQIRIGYKYITRTMGREAAYPSLVYPHCHHYSASAARGIERPRAVITPANHYAALAHPAAFFISACAGIYHASTEKGFLQTYLVFVIVNRGGGWLARRPINNRGTDLFIKRVRRVAFLKSRSILDTDLWKLMRSLSPDLGTCRDDCRP